MYLRLLLIFCLIFSWESAGRADLKPDTPNTVTTKAPDEITLEANLVQIILNDEHRSGVDWGAIVSDYHTAILKKQNDALEKDKKLRLSFGTISQEDYTVLLDSLDMAGQMSQFPEGIIKVTAEKPASIFFEKQDIHVDFVLSRLKSGDLSLRVDPTLANGSTASKVPVVNDTTVVIGGIIKEEEIKKIHKFPLLGDIPLVGLFFRVRGHLMQRTETVVFLTIRSNAVTAPGDDSST